MEDEIEKARQYNPPLDTLIVATTAETDAKLQEAVRQLPPENFNVEIWFWSFINNLLNRAPGAALDYAQQVLVGEPGHSEKQHATHLRDAIERPAFLHDSHQERSFHDQTDAVKDTLMFLRTGILYTRDGHLVSALPYRRYEDKYAMHLQDVIKAVERMDRHLSLSSGFLNGPYNSDFTRAASKLDILRLEVIDKVNIVMASHGLGAIQPSS